MNKSPGLDMLQEAFTFFSAPDATKRVTNSTQTNVGPRMVTDRLAMSADKDAHISNNAQERIPHQDHGRGMAL
jgi:hypothetical protein